jgi:hypothetical protein
MGFLAAVNARLDLEKQELRMLKCMNPDTVPGNRRARGAIGKASCVALTVFPKLNGHQSKQERQSKLRINNDMPRKGRSEHPQNVSIQDAESWVVKSTETIKIAPRAKQIVVARIELPKRRVSPDLVCVEPAQLPFEGLSPDRGLARVVTRPSEKRRPRTATPVMTCSDQLRGVPPPDRVHVM